MRARSSARAARLTRVCIPALLGVALLHCAPDFDSLSNGTAGGAGGAFSFGGSNGGATGELAGVGGVVGSGQAGASSNSGGAGAASAGGTSGAGQSSGGAPAGGSSSGGLSGASTVAAAGESGAGSSDPCAFSHPGAIAFDGFDAGFSGVGFAQATSTATIDTVSGSTASTAWDGAVGLTCPGSLRLTGGFKGYSSSSTMSELAIGDLRFTTANWTGAVALHAWVKVAPATAPIQGIQLFVISGTKFVYDSVFDDAAFKNGTWNEMILPLKTGAVFDPTSVIRIGIQILLKVAGSEGNPTVPPTTDAWMDDVWVEK